MQIKKLYVAQLNLLSQYVAVTSLIRRCAHTVKKGGIMERVVAFIAGLLVIFISTIYTLFVLLLSWLAILLIFFLLAPSITWYYVTMGIGKIMSKI
jgi:predicted membrane protein